MRFEVTRTGQEHMSPSRTEPRLRSRVGGGTLCITRQLSWLALASKRSLCRELVSWRRRPLSIALEAGPSCVLRGFLKGVLRVSHQKDGGPGSSLSCDWAPRGLARLTVERSPT